MIKTTIEHVLSFKECWELETIKFQNCLLIYTRVFIDPITPSLHYANKHHVMSAGDLYRTATRNWDRRSGQKKWHLNVITSTSDGTESQVFPANDNRCQQSRKTLGRHSCGPDQSQDGYFKLYWELLTTCVVGGVRRFVLIIYRGTSFLLCCVSFISVAERQFLLHV